MKANDYIIYSDMDGTMLSDWSLGPVVPEANLVALREFIAMGGAVSIATGRLPSDTLPFFEGIEFSAPLVLGNGSFLYDQRRGQVLHKELLPKACLMDAIDFVKEREDVWLVSADEKRMYQLAESAEKDARLDDGLFRVKCPEAELVKFDLTKLCFICENPSVMTQLLNRAECFESWPLVDASQSAAIHLEVMKRGVSKAEGIKRAITIAGLQHRTLVCLGDYHNDYEMLKMADIAACPANAAEEIRAISEIITCSNNEGAFACLLEKLL